jgi:hypothetical protein
VTPSSVIAAFAARMRGTRSRRGTESGDGGAGTSDDDRGALHGFGFSPEHVEEPGCGLGESAERVVARRTRT